MFLHILDRFGKTITVLDTRAKLSHLERAGLVYQHHNPRHHDQLEALRVFLALPGESNRLVRKSPPEQYHGCGVLSQHKNLNKLPRFTGSGEIKAADLPKTLRGEELFTYLDGLTKLDGPPAKAENLSPAWTKATAPRKARTLTADQLDKASKLREQGVPWLKVSAIVGAAKSSLMDAMREGV